MPHHIWKPIFYLSLCSVMCLDNFETAKVARAKDEVGDKERLDDERKWTARQIKRKGAVLRLLVPETASADELSLNIVLENRGKERFQCGDTGYFLDSKVTLCLRDGKRIPYSKLGKIIFTDDAGRKQYGDITFTPGRLRSWELNLAEAFEPLESGEYLLSLECTLRFEEPDTKEFTNRIQLHARDVLLRVTR